MTFACCDNLCPPDSFLQGFPFSASSTRGDSVITLQGSVQDPVRWNSSPKRNSFGKFPSIGGLALASVANEKSGSRAAQRPIWGVAGVRIGLSSISCTMSCPTLAHTSGSNSNFAWAPSRILASQKSAESSTFLCL